MRRVLAWSAAAAMALALPAAGAAEPEHDADRQAALAQRLKPFDAAQGAEWEEAFKAPYYRRIAAGGRDPVPMELTPGAYMVVVLCDCEAMDVSLVTPDTQVVRPVRVNDQGAMYSLDVKKAGTYLAGIDMGGCAQQGCGVAIKAYRRK